MEWLHVLTIIGANLGFTLLLFLWIRTEANADRRELYSMVMDLQSEYREELRDYHGRLCAIEEARKK